MYRRNSEINYEQVANFLKASVQQVKTQEDVDVLKQFKKFLRKTFRGICADMFRRIF